MHRAILSIILCAVGLSL